MKSKTHNYQLLIIERQESDSPDPKPNTNGLVTFRPSYVYGRPFSADPFRPSFDMKSRPKSANFGVIKRCY